MNAINESGIEFGCLSSCEKDEMKKVKKSEVIFSVILFVTTIYGVWAASSLAISFVSLM